MDLFAETPLSVLVHRNMSTIGSVIGKPLYTDRFTKSIERLSYARLCVEIDVAEELPDIAIIITEYGGTHLQKFIYDWKPSRCSSCCFGHGDLQCPNKVKPTRPTQVWKVKEKINNTTINTEQQVLSNEEADGNFVKYKKKNEESS